jgi:YHS domain-containing protein
MRIRTFANRPDECAVCDGPITAAKPLSQEFRGDVYFFCSPECLKKFNDDPRAAIGLADEEEQE